MIQLHRDLPISGFICRRFQFSLKFHTGKHIISREIFRCHRNNNGTVRIVTVSAVITHTINGKFSFLGRSIYDISARTHTKRVYTSSVRKLTGQLVICCRKRSPLFSVLGLIDQMLRMFHADTDRKSFR